MSMNTDTQPERMMRWHKQWMIDGDLCRCRVCKRGIVITRSAESFVHRADCSQAHLDSPWRDLNAVLAGHDPASVVALDKETAEDVKFKRGDRVTKIKGSKWTGVIVGEYSTSLTPEGYAVESETEKGSVQIYPAAALAKLTASMGGKV